MPAGDEDRVVRGVYEMVRTVGLDRRPRRMGLEACLLVIDQSSARTIGGGARSVGAAGCP